MTSTQMNAGVKSALMTTELKSNTKHERRIFLYRCMIFYRFLLAIVGGYILASLSAIVIAQLFIAHRSSAATSATMIAFALHCAVFIWVFMVNKTAKASMGIILPSILLFIVYKLLGN